jgi:hypothetical protein
MRLTVGASSRLESEMKSRKTKPQMKKTQTDDVSTDEVLECLKALRKAVRKKPNKKARINDVPTVEVTVEYLEALRKEVGRHIDPDTAEVDWVYAQVLDPYGDARDLPEQFQQVGRDYFARSPGSNLWIWFHDLPDAIADRLLEKHEHKLAFPAGLSGAK